MLIVGLIFVIVSLNPYNADGMFLGTGFVLLSIISVIMSMKDKIFLHSNEVVMRSFFRTKTYNLNEFDGYELMHSKYIPRSEWVKSLLLASVTLGVLRRRVKRSVGEIETIKLKKSDGGLFSTKKIKLKIYGSEERTQIINYVKSRIDSNQDQMQVIVNQ